MGSALRAGSDPPPRAHDVALLDLDGVVYTGGHAVPGASEAIRAARDAGLRIAFVTNNASRTPGEVAARLTGLGVPAEAAEVVTSAQAAAHLLVERLPAGAPVLAVGGAGLREALNEVGLVAVDRLAENPQAVVQGFSPDVGWAALAEAAFAVQDGVPWLATNLDLTLPTERGIAPGNGALVNAVRAATGVDPEVAGKPEPALVREAVRRTGAVRALVVGDRLDTDIVGAARAGLVSLLVLTGVSGLAELIQAPAASRPDLLSLDLSGLLATHPPVRVDAGVAACGAASSGVERGRLWIRQGRLPAGDTGRGRDGLDAVRAGLVAAWAAADGGEPVEVAAAVELMAGQVPAAAGARLRARRLG